VIEATEYRPHFAQSDYGVVFLLLTLATREHHGAAPAAPHIPTPAPAAEAGSFAALGLARDIVAALGQRGITAPFPVQTLTIPDALAGRDVCGKARTGSGKTLAFGLPLIQITSGSAPRRPRALVLVPTRELASQVVRELTPLAMPRRVRITAVYGGASLNRQADCLRAGIDIVVATPGRLHDLLERGAVSVSDVATVVLDEADQMADLGFLPQVERILSRIERDHQTLLFSATLDGAVDKLVRRYQKDPVFHEVAEAEETSSSMIHRFIGVAEAERVAVAAAIASGPARTLMFVRTQRAADRVARQLANTGLAAGVIHGGLSQPQRERALYAFSSRPSSVMVATNVAARGIHVDGVDIVVHFDPPEDTKTYLHRSGRTARAGAAGLVVTLVSAEQLRDVNLMRREANVAETVVDMAPADPRLADLGAWEPPLEDHTAPQAPVRRVEPTWNPRADAGSQRRRQSNWGRRPAAPGHQAERPRASAATAPAPSAQRRWEPRRDGR
jgi:superfamily II DNA/RNA helicase